MKKNRGSADSVIRLALAGIIALLYFTYTITGTLVIVLLGLAAVFVLTSYLSFLYLLESVPAKKITNYGTT